MRVIAIAAILMVGCATPQPGISSPSDVDQAQERLTRSEVRCIGEVVMRADDQMSNVVMNLGPLTQLEIQAVLLQRIEGARHCQAIAQRGQEGLASNEQASYENAEALERRIPLPVQAWSLSPP